jgi:predicted nucleic acid-binding protein
VTVYIDSSAVGKLLADEPESAALASHLDRLYGERVGLVSSTLLETELRRMGVRNGIDQATVSDTLDIVTLVMPTRSTFYQAGVLADRYVRSLDALHVATAVRLDVESFITYDDRQAHAARVGGLHIVAPGT